MTPLKKFLTNFDSATSSGQKPFMIKIGHTLAEDKELADFIGLRQGRAEYMGVTINVVPDFEVFATYKDAFPHVDLNEHKEDGTS